MSKKKISQSKTKKATVKPEALSGSEAVFTQLQGWAHAGTEESLKKIENFIIKEKNKDLREYAGLAHGEAQYFYYCSNNEKEEKEFELACMIKKEDDYLWKLISEADRLEYELGKIKIEQAVFKRLIKKQTVEKKKVWQYRFMGDVVGFSSRLEDIKDDIEYQIAWLKEARSMITTKRYKNIPDDVFEHMHTDFEDGNYWVDDFGCDNPCDEEDVHCPQCGLDNVTEYDGNIHPVGNYKEFNIEDIPF